MKKLADLLQKRSTLVGEMSAIITLADTEKRVRTADEEKNWEAKRKAVTDLNKEIEVLQTQDSLDRTIAENKLNKEEEKAVERYDLSRAIMARGQNLPLDGLELEMHQEADKEMNKISGRVGNIYIPAMIIAAMREQSAMTASQRATQTKALGSADGHIPLEIGPGSVIAEVPLYRNLGVTLIEGLTAGKIDLPFSKGNTVTKLAEGGTAIESDPTRTKETLTASRYHGWRKFSNEYLSETVMMPVMLMDFLAAIDRGVGADVVLQAVAANPLAGFGTGDAGAAMTWLKLLKQMSSIQSSSFAKEAFVSSRQLFFEMAGIEKAAQTAKFLVDNLQGGNHGFIGGVDAWGTEFLPIHDVTKYDSIYGDWKEAYVGFWGGAQILVDPFTASDDGETKITFSRMGDSVANPYAFTSIRNATVV